MWIAGFLLVLGPLVTLHELGHYLVGRWFGVEARAFSIGFGRELVGRTDSRGTRWKLSAIPLGGYVQFRGDMNPASVGGNGQQEQGSFHAARLWQRALIVAAGPVANLAIAVAIFAAFNLAYGKVETSTVVGGFAEQSAAREAGLRVGDRIVAIDGAATESFDQLGSRVLMHPGRTVTLSVERDGRQLSLPVTIASVTDTDRFGNESRIGRIGVLAGDPVIRQVGAVEAVSLAGEQTLGLMRMMVTGVGQIITGARSVDELGGPIKIAKFSGEQLSMGWLAFASFAALISINLAFINLLPIPGLDGGHLAFYAAEAVRRRPVDARSTEWAYRGGIALVLALMLFVTINDITALLRFG
ncbi:RIP metalloprotease RseP [Erythrobacteraceae bacterium CFH 75059]|nr:RIP metalloprotease RseP [Erythrobacteraceae bacterium CFH 75059]